MEDSGCLRFRSSRGGRSRSSGEILPARTSRILLYCLYFCAARVQDVSTSLGYGVETRMHTNIGILLDIIATGLLAAVRLGPVVLPRFQVRTQVLRLTFIFGSCLGIHDLSIDNGYKKNCKKKGVTANMLISCPPGVMVVSCLGCIARTRSKTRLGDRFLGRPPPAPRMDANPGNAFHALCRATPPHPVPGLAQMRTFLTDSLLSSQILSRRSPWPHHPTSPTMS